jgi:hypothetical protein
MLFLLVKACRDVMPDTREQGVETVIGEGGEGELCREAGSRDVPVEFVGSKRLIAENPPRGVAARRSLVQA